jgi:hypothetical protein
MNMNEIYILRLDTPSLATTVYTVAPPNPAILPPNIEAAAQLR